MEERRIMDKRMDSMEKDIREMRTDQKEMQKSVIEIREKIFNGFSHQIKEAHENTKELKDSMGVMNSSFDKLVTHVYRDDSQILESCPYKKENLVKVKRSTKFLYAGTMFFLTALHYSGEIVLMARGLFK